VVRSLRELVRERINSYAPFLRPDEITLGRVAHRPDFFRRPQGLTRWRGWGRHFAELPSLRLNLGVTARR